MNTNHQHNPDRDAQLLADENALRDRLDLTPELSSDFNQRLRQRLASESASASEKPSHHVTRGGLRFPGLARGGTIAAALIAIFLILWTPLLPNPNHENIAWADVQAAVAKVSSFQISFFLDEPRNAYSPKMMHIDAFHRAPDDWRLQGFNYFVIRQGDQMLAYDLEKHSELEDILFIDDQSIDIYREHGLLEFILRFLDFSETATQEPVQADIAQQAGLAVFDIADDPTKRWARVWVVRASRLPMRIEVFQPGSDDYCLINFDYTEDLTDSFFDIDAIKPQLNSNIKPYQAFRLGRQPVGGTKPTNATQINELRGGYQAGELLDIQSRANGDLMITVTDPDNHPAPGDFISHEGLPKSLHDNWGNAYINIGSMTKQPSSHAPRQQYNYYMPVDIPSSSFTTGQQPHTINLSYVIRFLDHVPNPKEDITLWTQDAMIPEPDTQSDSDWPGYGTSLDNRHLALYGYLRSASIETRIAHIDQWISEVPESPTAWIKRYNMLITLKQKEQAHQRFEETILPLILENDPFNVYCLRPMADHLNRLANDQRIDELQALITRLKAVRDQRLASKDLYVRREMEREINNPHNRLFQAMGWPKWLQVFENTPKPSLYSAYRDATDNRLLVNIRIPQLIMKGTQQQVRNNGKTQWNAWGSPHFNATGSGWHTHMGAANGDDFYTYLLRPRLAHDLNPDKLSVNFTVVFPAPTHAPMNLDWRLPINPQDIQTIDHDTFEQKRISTIQAWEKQGVRYAPPSEITTLQTEISDLIDAQQYQPAFDRITTILNTPDEQWPDSIRTSYVFSTLETGIQRARRKLISQKITCLIGLDQFATAEQIIKEAEDKLPPLNQPGGPSNDDKIDRLILDRQQECIEHYAQLITALRQHDQTEHADALHNRLLEALPISYDAIPTYQTDEGQTPLGGSWQSTWSPRSEAQKLRITLLATPSINQDERPSRMPDK